MSHVRSKKTKAKASIQHNIQAHYIKPIENAKTDKKIIDFIKAIPEWISNNKIISSLALACGIASTVAPPMLNYYIKSQFSKMVAKLDYYYTTKDYRNLYKELNSIKDNTKFFDTYNYYSALLAWKDPSRNISGPRIFFDKITPNSVYYEKMLDKHYEYICSIDNNTYKANEIEHYLNFRLGNNKQHHLYYLCLSRCLITLHNNNKSIALEKNPDKWMALLSNYRSNMSNILDFRNFPPISLKAASINPNGLVRISVPKKVLEDFYLTEFILLFGVAKSLQANGMDASQFIERLSLYLNMDGGSTGVSYSYPKKSPDYTRPSIHINLKQRLNDDAYSTILAHANDMILKHAN